MKVTCMLWRSTNGFKIRRLGDHKCLFVFDNLPDVDRIIKNQPWSFDKYLVVIQRYDGESPVRELIFNKAMFWVQVHDIPYRYMTKHMAECLCDIIGEVQKSSGAVDDDGGQFMRVRVTLDINLPLCRGRVITIEGGGKSWVSFKYERLPNLCYWCGGLSHDEKNCDLWINSKGTLKVENQQFGPCLRAAPYTSAGKDVIYIPGYYENRFSKPDNLSQCPVDVVAMEVGVNSEASVEHSVKGKAQVEELVNVVSVPNSNSPAGMEEVTHDKLNKSIPKYSEVVSQLVMEIPTD